MCLKRLITPGLQSLEAFGFVRASVSSLHRSVYRRSNIYLYIFIGERERANLVVHLAAIFLYYIYIYNGRCTYRNSNSTTTHIGPITAADYPLYNRRCTYRNSNLTTTRTKLQTSVYALHTVLVHYTRDRKMLQKARRKRRHDYPDAEVETEGGVPHSLRRPRNIVAALKPESVETEIKERGVSIQKARMKRRHDYPARR